MPSLFASRLVFRSPISGVLLHSGATNQASGTECIVPESGTLSVSDGSQISEVQSEFAGYSLEKVGNIPCEPLTLYTVARAGHADRADDVSVPI